MEKKRCIRFLSPSSLSSSLFFIVLPLLVLQRLAPVYSDVSSGNAAPSTCSAIQDEQDPALQEMTYDVGNGQESCLVYVQPDVTSFYLGTPPAKRAVAPKFKGLAGKFVNMSNKRLRLYWDAGPGQLGSLIANCQPFMSVGTSTFPGHKFYFSPYDDPKTRIIEWTVQKSRSVYFYDPYEVQGDSKATQRNLAEASLSLDELKLYETLRKTRLFNKQYSAVTGRDYLANYLRKRPSNYIWRADYFGQEHWVTTKETHFAALPPPEKLKSITTYGKKRVIPDDAPRLLHEYRTDEPFMNMTMKVISCAPRAFEIENFLSEVEVHHILHLATGMNLAVSTTGESGDKHDAADNRRTRTSYNTWVAREKSPIIDAIYRRAADLLRIDEALLRHRGDGEYPDLGTDKTIAESLQLVHYDPGQEYTAHHDFGYSELHRWHQQARFATLLLYLNEGMEGGETSFPRWVNAETFEELKAVPKQGKAVLFYSQLPDGNLDDLSQHAALPVVVGEKWLMNLWVHDPIYEL